MTAPNMRFPCISGASSTQQGLLMRAASRNTSCQGSPYFLRACDRSQRQGQESQELKSGLSSCGEQVPGAVVGAVGTIPPF